MPEHEDALGLEVLLGLDEVLDVVVAVVGDLGPHVVDHEGLGEVKLVVGVGHGLEVDGHRCAGLHIADLVAARGRRHVCVEELGGRRAVLGEVGVRETCLPLLVEVDHVEGLWGEEAGDFLVLKNGVEEPDLVEGRLGALVANAGVEGDRGGEQVQLPDGRLREHHEGEPDPAGEHAGPRVVRAVHAGADLENVVGSAETPLEVIVSEDGVAILEFLGVAVGLLGLVLVGVIDRPGVVIQVVVALGWLVAQVVPLGVGVLSEVAHGRVSQHSLKKNTFTPTAKTYNDLRVILHHF